MAGTVWEWVAAGFLGAVIGSASIFTRYRDEPDNALRTWPALFYLLVNALASMLAFLVIRIFGWDFGMDDPLGAAWLQVLAAGFGAMTILRVSLPFKIGDSTVSIGLNQALEAVFVAVDRAVDRKRGQQRAKVVYEKMREVSFERASVALPAYCFALLQNLSQTDQEMFARRVTLLRSADLSPRVKSYLLGLSLLNLVGDEILKTGVDNLGDEIKDLPVTTTTTLTTTETVSVTVEPQPVVPAESE
jgi:hypothetical protein